MEPELSRQCTAVLVGDILDSHLLERLRGEFEISAVFHLAALLSTRAEFVPETAHEVNVQGTLGLLRLAVEEARSHGRPVKFLFPSSIAVYGLPDLRTKREAGRIVEREWLLPVTMYGCNKLYCEHLGRYFARHYHQLAVQAEPSGVDFRAIRFPGLISAFTVPSGGTSDYASEMIHAAAQDRPYACFVREDTRIPFMAMPDAITALLALLDASRGIGDDPRRTTSPASARARVSWPPSSGKPSRAPRLPLFPIDVGRPSWIPGRRTWTTLALEMTGDSRLRTISSARSPSTSCPTSCAGTPGASDRSFGASSHGDEPCTERRRTDFKPSSTRSAMRDSGRASTSSRGRRGRGWPWADARC